jgi:7-cyano-7-deazaguanine synthase
MNITGRVWVYGDNINTDLIYPGRYLKIVDLSDMSKHAMKGLDENFSKNVRDGDIIVAGKNFGCGSSREQAVISLKHAGIRCIIAKSISRIFYRNAINLGMFVIECPEVSNLNLKSMDKINVDFENCKITNLINKKSVKFNRIPKLMMDIINAGGLLEYHKMFKKAVCLVSGGIDSACVLGIAISERYDVHALTFDYGQKHKKEIESAKKIANFYGIEHKILKIDLTQIGGSALTEDIPIPMNRTEIGSDIPVTYVPARNTIFLSLAVAYAEVVDAYKIFIGATAVDYSGYPDCRPNYFEAFQKVIDIGTKRGVEGKQIKIEYPLVNMSKSDIIKRCIELKVPLHLTWSCYVGDENPCGKCDSCRLRAIGFKEAGIVDPIGRVDNE